MSEQSSVDQKSNCQSSGVVGYPSLSLRIDTDNGQKDVLINNDKTTKISIQRDGKSQFVNGV